MIKKLLTAITSTGLATSACFAQQPGASPVPNRIDQVNAQSSVATATSMDKLDSSRELLIGDVLSFRIVEDEEPVSRLVITDSGEVDVPYLGLLPAKGKTCKELAGIVKKQLEKDYYHKATVIIGLNYNIYGSRSIAGAPRAALATANGTSRVKPQLLAKDGVTIMGLVTAPGIYEIAEDTGDGFLLSHAILRAGGLKPFANDKKVRIISKSDEDAGSTTRTVNLRDIMKHGKLDQDIPIHRGDVIIVDRRTFNF